MSEVSKSIRLSEVFPPEVLLEIRSETLIKPEPNEDYLFLLISRYVYIIYGEYIPDELIDIIKLSHTYSFDFWKYIKCDILNNIYSSKNIKNYNYGFAFSNFGWNKGKHKIIMEPTYDNNEFELAIGICTKLNVKSGPHWYLEDINAGQSYYAYFHEIRGFQYMASKDGKQIYCTETMNARNKKTRRMKANYGTHATVIELNVDCDNWVYWIGFKEWYAQMWKGPKMKINPNKYYPVLCLEQNMEVKVLDFY